VVLTVIWQSDPAEEEDDILARRRRKGSRNGGPPSGDETVTYLGRRRVAMDKDLEWRKMVVLLWAVRQGGINMGGSIGGR
jgi:hypothetical protein